MNTSKISKELELLAATIGASQALYLAVYIFFEKRDYKNILLAGLFFCVTLRIVKSVLWVYWEAAPNWFINLGFAAHSALGPLLLLYVFSFVYHKKWSHWNAIHFIPTAILTVLMGVFTLHNFWYTGGYTALLIHQMLYSVAAVAVLLAAWVRKPDLYGRLNKKDWIWLAILTLGMFVLHTAYFSNYILRLTPYLLGPVVYAVLVYFLSYFGLKNRDIFIRKQKTKKYENINLTSQIRTQHKQRIDRFVIQEKFYLRTDCSVKTVADKVKMPAYLISHVINTVYNQTFSEFVNSHRIIEAKRLLQLPEYQQYKISTIAYECGFNSLSAFNAAFKKYAGMTPTAWKSLPDL